jgi:hypothetical protein
MALDIDGTGGVLGDVVTAIMEVDSTLKRMHGSGPIDHIDDDQLAAALVVPTVEQAGDVLLGYCTVIYLFVTLWRKAGADLGRPTLAAEGIARAVERLRFMTATVKPSVIPTMAALMTAAAIQISPDQWRAQYGQWRQEELSAVQVTAVLIAADINVTQRNPDAALRLIIDTLASGEERQQRDET